MKPSKLGRPPGDSGFSSTRSPISPLQPLMKLSQASEARRKALKAIVASCLTVQRGETRHVFRKAEPHWSFVGDRREVAASTHDFVLRSFLDEHHGDVVDEALAKGGLPGGLEGLSQLYTLKEWTEFISVPLYDRLPGLDAKFTSSMERASAPHGGVPGEQVDSLVVDLVSKSGIAHLKIRAALQKFFMA